MDMIFLPKNFVEDLLASPAVPGKHLLESFQHFASGKSIPFMLLEDAVPMERPDAEVHTHEGDMWYCLEGSATFLCGGELVDGQARKNADGSVNRNEWFAKAIRGGTKYEVRAGDWLWIPHGEPHQHWSTVQARMMVIKVPKK